MTTPRNGAALAPVDHLRPVAGPSRVGQATAVEQSRAVAEVQAAVLVAQQMPRDVEQARDEMRRSCSEPELADRAFYRFPRGGQTVTGASIHLAREVARAWGNIDYGIAEMRRDDDLGQSEMRAWAWDQQTNSRASTTFIVPHGRDKDNGQRQPLTSLRDIYENNANMGGRRVREMIFAVLPVWLVKEAERLCRETIERGDGTPLARRVDAVVAAFAKLDVSVARLEAKVGRARHLWTAYDVADLTVVGQSIKAGEIAVADEFPADPERVTLDELSTNMAAAEPVPVGADEPTEQELAADTADGFAVTVADLLAALKLAGRTTDKTSTADALAALVAAATELVGVTVTKPEQLTADQAVAEELLARLTPQPE